MAFKLVQDQSEEESFGKGILRQGGRAVASGVTGAVGGIGDLANLASRGAEKIGLASPEGAEEFRKKTLTSEKVRRGLEEQFPSLKPRNKIEKFSDDVFETAAGLGKSSLLKKFGLSIGSNIAKESVDQFQGEENSKSGQYTKAGVLFLGSMIDPKKAAQEASKKYQQAQSLLPQGSQVPARNLVNKLDSLESNITKGRPKSSLSSAENFVIQQIDKTKGLVKNGQISIEQAAAQKKSLYEDLGNLYAEFGQAGAKTVKNQSKNIPKFLNQTLEEYGKYNPEYYKTLKQADELYGTIASSKGFERWISNTFKNTPITKMAIFGALSPANEAGKLLYKIGKSPEMRKLYAKAIGEATEYNAKSFAKTAEQLDSLLKEEESREKWRFLD